MDLPGVGEEATGAVRRLPVDLVAVLVLLGVTDVVLLVPVIKDTPLRIPFGFLVLLFLPGYVLTALIFPESRRESEPSATDDGGDVDGETADGRRDSPDETADELTDETADELTDDSVGPRGIDGIERVTLSIALSLVIVMATALAVHLSGVGISVPSTLAVLNAVIVVTTAGAVVRRRRAPPDRQFQLRSGPSRQTLRAMVDDFDRIDRVLGVVFLLLVLFVAVGTAYTVVVPSEADRSTEFFLLAEDADGNLTGSNYPTEFVAGESRSLVVGVTNNEFRPTDYTVVVELQNVTRRSNDAPVRSERELARFQGRIEHGDTWRQPHTITPEQTGQNLRLQYLLYRGDPPAEPARDNAYRRVHLWVNVSAPNTSTSP